MTADARPMPVTTRSLDLPVVRDLGEAARPGVTGPAVVEPAVVEPAVLRPPVARLAVIVPSR